MTSAATKGRRLCHLTLTRQEWEDLVASLAELSEVAWSCGPALVSLRAQLDRAGSAPHDVVTISQPPLSWSPLVMGLALHVLARPTLLPLAERLRDQMAAQAKRIEASVQPDHSANVRRWPGVPSDHLRGRVAPN